MRKENQIDEMAKATIKHCKIDNQCGSCHWSTCNECLAEALYNAGYRKQNAVIDEFAERLKEEMENLTRMVYSDTTVYLVGKSLIDRIAEEMKGGAE